MGNRTLTKLNSTGRSELKRDILLCGLIVLISILLHSLAMPLFMLDEDAKEEHTIDGGLPYLSEFDSYLYARLTEEVADRGLSGYELRHSRAEDPYIAANASDDEGDVVMGLPMLGATVYRLISWIPGVTVYGVIFWLAPFITSLAAIPAYAFVKRRTNRIGGLVAGVLIACAEPFVACTTAGYYDTDLGLSLLPCLYLLCFAEAIIARTRRSRIGWAVASGVSLCGLSLFWRAYYAYFCIGIAAACCVLFAHFVVTIVRSLISRRTVSSENETAVSVSSDDAGTPIEEAAVDAGIPSETPSPGAVAYAGGIRGFFRSTELRGAALGLLTQVLCCLLTRGRELFTDIGGLLGQVRGTIAGGSTAFPDAARYVSELQPTPLIGDYYNKGILLRLLNGFAAYDNGTINELGAWLILFFTIATVIFLIIHCFRAAFGKRAVAFRPEAEPAATSVFGDVRTFISVAVFLCVWLGCGVIIAFKGSRFSKIPALPIGVMCGLGAGIFACLLRRMVIARREAERRSLPLPLSVAMVVLSAATMGFSLRPELGWTICLVVLGAVLVIGLGFTFLGDSTMPAVIFLCALIYVPIITCFGYGYSAYPSADDTLNEVCRFIDENAEPDAVIASWWDFGYFYEYAARRKTLGDGGTFNGEWNYFTAKALVTEDTALSHGIFRMLDAGGLDACHLMMREYGVYDETTDNGMKAAARRAVNLLLTILPMSREDARTELQAHNFPADRIDELLALTHPETTHPIYLVVSTDMFRILGVIRDFGYWDFGTTTYSPEVWMNEDCPYIAPGQSAVINLKDSTYRVRISVSATGETTAELLREDDTTVPTTLRYDNAVGTDGTFPIYPEATGFYTIYLRKDGNCYRCLVCGSRFADSVFMRSFMSEGNALRYRKVTGGTMTIDRPDNLPGESDGNRREFSVWRYGE